MQLKPKYFRPLYAAGKQPPKTIGVLRRCTTKEEGQVVLLESDELIPAELVDNLGQLTNPSSGIIFRRMGDFWMFGPPMEVKYYKHTKGLAILHYLLQRPGQSVENVALYHGGEPLKEDFPKSDERLMHRDTETDKRLLSKGQKQGFQHVNNKLDDIGRNDIKKKLLEMVEERQKLVRDGARTDHPEIIRLDNEYEAMGSYLQEQMFSADANAENFRRNISLHIHTAINRISKDFAGLGKSLLANVTPQKGHLWLYRPTGTENWILE